MDPDGYRVLGEGCLRVGREREFGQLLVGDTDAWDYTAIAHIDKPTFSRCAWRLGGER